MSPWCVVLVCNWRRCPSLGPFPSISGGAHRPLTTLCPSSSSLPYFPLSTSLSWPLAFPSVGGGAHRPLTTLCPSSSSLPHLSLSTSLSFPLVGCANGAPGLSMFAPCQVHTEEGKCPHCWPGVFKRSSQTGSEGPLGTHAHKSTHNLPPSFLAAFKICKSHLVEHPDDAFSARSSSSSFVELVERATPPSDQWYSFIYYTFGEQRPFGFESSDVLK